MNRSSGPLKGIFGVRTSRRRRRPRPRRSPSRSRPGRRCSRASARDVPVRTCLKLMSEKWGHSTPQDALRVERREEEPEHRREEQQSEDDEDQFENVLSNLAALGLRVLRGHDRRRRSAPPMRRAPATVPSSCLAGSFRPPRRDANVEHAEDRRDDAPSRCRSGRRRRGC